MEEVPIQNAQILTQEIDSDQPLKKEAVLVLPEYGQVKVLNELGAFIWKRIDGLRTIKEILQDIISEYNVDYTQAESDLTEFLVQLINRNIIIIK